jgi:ribonuclease HI
MGASTLTLEGITDPATMEAIACREAMALAQDLLVDRVTIASGCLSVVNAIHSKFAGSFSVVIDEIKEVASSLSLVSFRHESRESNHEAHRLARSATTRGLGRRVWFDQPPDGLCIRYFVLNE